MRTVEELEALLETVTRERDDLTQRLLDMVLQRNDVRDKLDICGLNLVTAKRERDLSLAAWESAGMQGRTAQSAMLELARQLEEARDTIVALTTAMAEKDLEIVTLTDERDELLVRVAHQDAELRAARAAYRKAHAELKRERIGIRPTDEVRSDAYRRGAEAMREACARVADAHFVPGTRDVIHALPIPEEP